MNRAEVHQVLLACEESALAEESSWPDLPNLAARAPDPSSEETAAAQTASAHAPEDAASIPTPLPAPTPPPMREAPSAATGAALEDGRGPGSLPPAAQRGPASADRIVVALSATHRPTGSAAQPPPLATPCPGDSAAEPAGHPDAPPLPVPAGKGKIRPAATPVMPHANSTTAPNAPRPASAAPSRLPAPPPAMAPAAGPLPARGDAKTGATPPIGADLRSAASVATDSRRASLPFPSAGAPRYLAGQPSALCPPPHSAAMPGFLPTPPAPSLAAPSRPADVGSRIADDIAAIRANTAKLLEQGIL